MPSERRISLNPPLVNASSPWATELSQLSALYASPLTGAITTRTSLIDGFPHDPEVHKFVFISPSTAPSVIQASHSLGIGVGAVNTYGYSPYSLSTYLAVLPRLPPPPPTISNKPVIISITGSPSAIIASLSLIDPRNNNMPTTIPLWIEVNLSCPNIPNAPPPAYSKEDLITYISAISGARSSLSLPPMTRIGIKTPPYTYSAQFEALIAALVENGKGVIDFITACNTLGGALHFFPSSISSPPQQEPGFLLGGLSGPGLHNIALGNVYTLRKMLDENGMTEIGIIGVGGVSDKGGFERMRKAGADVVGIGVGLGVQMEFLGAEEGVQKAFEGLVG